MMRDRANITIAIRKEVWYLPSIGAMVNVVHRDLGLYFQCCHKPSGNHTIFNIWKTVRACEKCSSTTFIEVDAGH